MAKLTPNTIITEFLTFGGTGCPNLHLAKGRITREFGGPRYVKVT